MNAVTIIRTQAEIADAPTTVLIATYNALTGKGVTKFSSRAAGEAQVANAILKGQDNAAHAGVPKGTDDKAIKAITKEEAASVKAVDPVTTTTTEGTNVKKTDKQLSREEVRAKRFPTATAQDRAAAASAKKAPAKKAPAKKAAAAAKKAPAKKVAATYQFIKSTTPDVPRRPQAESTRTVVLKAIQELGKGGKKISMDALDAKLGFNSRPFVHKLARNGWCEVVGGDKA